MNVNDFLFLSNMNRNCHVFLQKERLNKEQFDLLLSNRHPGQV
jgi:hypothetical protein